MFQGELLAITTRPARKQAVESHDSAVLIPGEGIEGDHRCEAGCEPLRQVTLIESEALELAAADYELELTHAESRRNLLTRRAPLNQLVGVRFRVGDAVLEGVELCEPCTYLEGCLGRKIVKALTHRGGLRAKIIEGAEIRIGDEITPLE